MSKRQNIPNLTGLRAFDALCRTGSVSAASVDLKVTPGAVSRQISQLENTLGRSLFSRTGGRLTLTESGRLYETEIRAAFDLIELATESVSARVNDNQLIITCPPSFHFCWLLKRLPLFEAKHSEITTIVHTELSTHARGATIDGVIGVGEWPSDTSLTQSKFMGNYSGPVMAPHLAATLEARSPKIPPELRLLALRKQPDIWLDWLKETNRTLDHTPKCAEMDHLFLTVEAAKAGLGAAIAPYAYVSEDISAGTLVAPFGFLERKVPYFIAWQTSAGKKTALTKFTAWLREEGQKTPVPA